MSDKKSYIILIFLIIFNSLAMSGGVVRSTGVGLRASFWNIAGQNTSIRIVNNGSQSQVAISGTGAYLYFFSRIYNNWFFETTVGAIGDISVESSDTAMRTHVSSIVPLLFGVRMDLLSTRLSGPVHPYLSLGGGPYWSATEETGNFDDPDNLLIETAVDYGWYTGVGTNIMLSSWAGFNFDLKYHFVDFKESSEFDSGLEFGMGFSFMWGQKRDIFRIREVKLLVPNIYPAYYQFYSTYPLALVNVQNLIGHDIEVSVRCTVKGYSEKPKDSEFVRIGGGQSKDIPVTAFLGKNIYAVSQRDAAIMDLVITARTGVTVTKQYSTQLLIHSHNAWNGEMDKLPFFITSDDERILATGRDMIEQDSERTTTSFSMARAIFEKLAQRGIRYHPDPEVFFYQDDRVQFAWETLENNTGDCDDLSVLYISLLQSVGIKTAFVEVRDPEETMAHLYVMFDTGVSADQANQISSNEKRYVLRTSSANQQTAWIPVETTLITDGFEKAWSAAAMNYLQESILRNGLVEGWVRIIDVE